jgi:hypothetical protein
MGQPARAGPRGPADLNAVVFDGGPAGARPMDGPSTRTQVAPRQAPT